MSWRQASAHLKAVFPAPDAAYDNVDSLLRA